MSFKPSDRLAHLKQLRNGPFTVLPSVQEFNTEYFTSDLDKCKLIVLHILNQFAARKCITLLHEIYIRDYVTVSQLLEPYSIAIEKMTPEIRGDKAIFQFTLDPNKLAIFK